MSSSPRARDSWEEVVPLREKAIAEFVGLLAPPLSLQIALDFEQRR
jgi:hypothetical protein